MRKLIKKIALGTNHLLLSSIASFALVVVTFAANQRCWYIVHEEELPDSCKQFRKF